MKPGDTIIRYVPWMAGARACKVIEKRAAKEGEYFLRNDAVFQRKGSTFISDTERRRVYWIVEPGEQV